MADRPVFTKQYICKYDDVNTQSGRFWRGGVGAGDVGDFRPTRAFANDHR